MKNDRPFLQLLQYMRFHRSTIILATIFSVLNKLFDLAPPFLISAAVDIAVRRENSIFGFFGITDLETQYNGPPDPRNAEQNEHRVHSKALYCRLNPIAFALFNIS